ncbi:homocysteine S-methyltransferase family protein [Nocardioides marmoraquaticus]
MTLGYVDEAVGIARACSAVDIALVVSYTVETDGRLPDGTPLRAAVERTEAETDASPAGYMVNCAHATHLDGALTEGPWLDRVVGLRANASALSHAELDAATDLDPGDPDDLARRYRDLLEVLPHLDLVGGCCGTGLAHVAAIADTCLPGGGPAL